MPSCQLRALSALVVLTVTVCAAPAGAEVLEKARTVAGVGRVDVVNHCATYDEGLREAMAQVSGRSLIAFLGSNIGNFDPPGAAEFLHDLRTSLNKDDALLIGVDLVKDPETRDQDPEAFAHLQRYCLDRDLIIIDCGPDGNIIRFIPPLVTTRDELDWAIDLIDAGLADYEGR